MVVTKIATFVYSALNLTKICNISLWTKLTFQKFGDEMGSLIRIQEILNRFTTVSLEALKHLLTIVHNK